YVPPKPSDLADYDVEFRGWYKDEAFTQLFDFNITMPPNGIEIYAKWSADPQDVKAYHTISGGQDFSEFQVEYGGLIDEKQLPNIDPPEGMKWIGWATKNGDTYTLYNFNERVFHDIELYPYYIGNKSYYINYDANGGTGTVKDEMAYSSGVFATVKSDQGLTPPLDKNNNPKVFLGWSLTENGAATYYPGAKLFIDGHGDSAITLYAVWGDKQTTTTVTYHSNYPDGTDNTEVHSNERIINNSYIELKSSADVGFAYENYIFMGWSRTATGSAEFKAGSKVGVDNNGNIASATNDLYAIWQKKKEVTVTITGEQHNEAYDGQSHSVSFTLEASDTSYDLSNVYYNGKVYQHNTADTTISRKDAGKSEMGLQTTDFENKDTSVIVTFVVAQDAIIDIARRKVTLTSETASKPYDGTPLTKPNVTVEGDGFVEGELSEVKATGSVLTMAESPKQNTIEWKLKTGFNENNYDVTKNEGTLTITGNTAKIIVTAASDQKKYDGKVLTNDKLTVTGVPDGFTWTGKAEGSITNYDENKNGNNKVAEFVIKNKAGDDVTDQFTGITKNNGTLTIEQRKVKLISEGGSKPYDGTPLTKPNVKVEGDGFVDGELLEIKANGSVLTTADGEKTNTITWKLKEGFKESNYAVSKDEGKLKITGNTAKIIVTAASDHKMYDGKAFTKDELTVTGVPDGFTWTGKAEGSITNYDENKNGNNKVAKFVILNKVGDDVTDQFTGITKNNGTLTIDQRKVKLISEGGSKPYDGTPLTKPNVKVEGDGFVQGEILELKANGSVLTTADGEKPNTIIWKLKEGFKESNYAVSKDEGKLKITENTTEIIVTAASDHKMYDGKAFTKDELTVTGVPDGYTWTGKAEGSITNYDENRAGNNIVAEFSIFNEAGEDVTDQFAGIKKNSGTLTIDQRKVKLISEGGSKPYDGTPLTKPNVKVEGDGFVQGEILEVKANGSVLTTADGEKTNTITWKLKDGFKKTNYEVSKDEGKLKITENTTEIIVTAASDHKMYDGKAFTKDELTVTGVPDGFTWTGKAAGSITNYDENKNGNNKVAEFVILNKDGDNVTDQFSGITKNSGTLTIDQRKVKLISEGGSKPYDGTPLTKPNVKVEGDGFVQGEILELKANGSVLTTADGEITNNITWKLKDGFKKTNYEVSKDEGKLKITENTTEIIVTAASDHKTYDGKAFTKDELTVTGVPDGFTWTGKAAGSITNYDENKSGNNIVVEFSILNKDGNDVTDQFTGIEKNNGTLTIEQRKVILTSETAEKPYDGIPLTKPDVTVEGDGFVDGEISDLKATGSATTTQDGEQTNTIVWTKLQNYKDSNYDIEPHEGTLKINENTSEIVVTAATGFRMYNGTTYTNDTYTTTGLPAGLTAEATIEGSVTNVREGTVANVVKDVVIKDADKNDVTNQFTNIHTADGIIRVTARNVRLISKSAQKVFDNTPLTEPEVTVEGDGFVAGEVTDLHARGSITRVGNTTNDIVYTKTGAFIDSNYNITEEIGTLVVIPSGDQIVVTSGSATKMYDGTPLTLAGVTATMPARFTGYTVQANTTGTVTNVNQGAVRNAITGIRILDPTGNDVTNNFEADAITVVEGTLTITPRTVVLTSGSATKAFDGTPITNYQIIVTGDGFVAGEGLLYNVTGAQTAVGSSDNTFGYTAQAGTQLTNYQITVVPGTLTITEGAIVPINPPAPVPVPPQPNPQPNPVTPTTPEVIQLTPTVPTPSPTPEVVQVDDVETPLANIPEKCNALPFLLLLAAWIVLMIFAASMKKQQKRIFEMTEEKNNKEIDIELLSRKKQTSNKM
ncbi:MAG: InlB B-repeat-containing protein, partial [Eubacterium sp.]|nr:InlB B-repeat-containing protein [Eubacterium sp.]